ncbi:hypothetical protein [Croceivirga sp. JEA036]|uniref:hypothetical protein n=1 Tax=Croceivirga sp. JEA036 TaxID=2721162 RepID=UPI0014394F99|nr:hypothetical protein [Croceivirga sp. JEA036]NJB36389.1 hypothetical protein [Croceivirga sp. JEA036]
MSKYKIGFESLKVFDINATTGLAEAGTELDLTQDVLRDTFDFNEEDGTDTEIYSEMNNTPVVSFSEPGKETLSFGQMDCSVDKLAAFAGGTVTDNGDGTKTWAKPDNQAGIYKRMEITTTDGAVMVVARAKVKALKNLQFRRNNIWTLDLTFTVVAPLVDGVQALTVTDPADA